LLAAPTVSGTQIQLDFTVSNYRTGMNFQLLRTTDLQAPWTPDSLATLQTVVANSQFRFTSSTAAGANGFFKIKGN
jgi:hypothetical protein